MSRIGKQPITIPSAAKIEVKDGVLIAEGPKGKVEQKLLPECPIKIEDGVLQVSRKDDSGPAKAKHGLMRSLLNNAVVGVTEGFRKELEIVGVGYRGEIKGKEIHFALGYSHPIVFPIPEGVKAEIDRNNKITLDSADRQLLGQVAANIRSLRPPDPYKAKGIRYSDEHIRRKEGKSGSR